MPRRHSQPAHATDVTRETELELSTRKVPYLDDSVARTSGEPLVARFDSDGADPAQVARDDTDELPWRMVRWLDCPCRFVQLKCAREVGVGGKGGGFWGRGVVYLRDHTSGICCGCRTCKTMK